MRFFVQVILIYCLFITQTTEGQTNESNDELGEKEENKTTFNLNFKEFTMENFYRNQKCLEQYGGTQYYDLRYDECKPCESLENSHQTHTLCPEYQFKKTNKELEKANKKREKANKKLEKVNKELEKKLELMELETRKQMKTLSCVVQADHKSYYDEESDECVSCDNCKIGKECQMICAGSKGADPALILSVILIILAIVSPIVIIVFVVRYTVRIRRSARDRQTDGSTLSSKSVGSSMGNTTCAGDKSSGYITDKERAMSSSGHFRFVDEQNESCEESTGLQHMEQNNESEKTAERKRLYGDPRVSEKTPVRYIEDVACPQTDTSSLSSKSVESSMDNTTSAGDKSSGYIPDKERTMSSSCLLCIVDEQNETSEESTGLQNVEQNNESENTPERKSLYGDPRTDISEKTPVLYVDCPSADTSSLSSESVEISIDNITCPGDTSSGYIPGKETAGPSSCYLSIVDKQNETGYPVLKPMKVNRKKEFRIPKARGKHDAPMFDPKCEVSKIPHPDCSKLSDACKSEITQGDSAARIKAMQEEHTIVEVIRHLQ